MKEKLKEKIEEIMELADDMQVTVGKKVMLLSEAPDLVQIRWFKARVQELEAEATPAREAKPTEGAVEETAAAK